MVSSSFAMSDRRASRHRAPVSVDLQGHPAFSQFNRFGIRGPSRLNRTGAARLNLDRSQPASRQGKQDDARYRRVELLIRRLPARIQPAIHWLLRPAARWVRIPAGLLLITGGVLSILPVLGLWMLPLGLILLAEDIPPLRRATGRLLEWIERRHPRWLGLQRECRQ